MQVLAAVLKAILCLFSDGKKQDKKSNRLAVGFMLQPQVFAGPQVAVNRDALDWGWTGCVAYGASNTVVVVDPRSVQVSALRRLCPLDYSSCAPGWGLGRCFRRWRRRSCRLR